MSLKHPVGAGKERKKGDTGNIPKGYRSQPERASNSQNWNKLHCKIMTVLEHNPNNKYP